MSNNAARRRRVIALAEAQGWCCWICGHRMLRPKPPGQGNPSRIDATLDHLEPRHKRPRNTPREVKAAHRWCNSARGHAGALSRRHQARIDILFSNPAWVKLAFPDGPVHQEEQRAAA